MKTITQIQTKNFIKNVISTEGKFRVNVQNWVGKRETDTSVRK